MSTTGDGPAAPDWHRALAYALTGEPVELPGPAATEVDVPRLVEGLTAAGWSPEQLAAGARRPHLVPAELRTGLSAAQWHAVLGEVRTRLGATGLHWRAARADASLTTEDRRLLADRPPHWG